MRGAEPPPSSPVGLWNPLMDRGNGRQDMVRDDADRDRLVVHRHPTTPHLTRQAMFVTKFVAPQAPTRFLVERWWERLGSESSSGVLVCA
jgi:hypothetical protein